MVCRSMLASDSGEMDSALFLLSRGVSRGLENRDTRHKQTQQQQLYAFLFDNLLLKLILTRPEELS